MAGHGDEIADWLEELEMQPIFRKNSDNKLSDWVWELDLLKKTFTTAAYCNLEKAINQAYEQFLGNVRTIHRKTEDLVLESEHYMEDEEQNVLQLIEKGEVFVAESIKWPVPLARPKFHLTPSFYFQSNLKSLEETNSVLSSLDFTMKSSVSFEKSPGEAAIELSSFLMKPLTPELPEEPSVTHSVLSSKSFVRDVAHSEGLTFYTAKNEGRLGLFQLEFNESEPSQISASFDCLDICLKGSEELLVTKANWKEEEMTCHGTNHIRGFQLMKDLDPKPTEMEEAYEVVGGKFLTGLSSSPEGLVAACDPISRRITVHCTGPWTRVDTIQFDHLFAHQLSPSPDDDHLKPFEVTWLDEDRLCVKMFNQQTINCLSLKLKEIIWTKEVPRAFLLSSAYGRVYVGHFDQPARFTVLRADSGDFLPNEKISCPGKRRSLKCFPSHKGEGGGVVAFSC